jgi:hypothetical protein
MANKKHLLVTGLSFNKLADLLISAKTTLPALLIILGAPAWMVGWLVPIRESGALLPQVLISMYLRNNAARYKVWRVGICIQIASVVGILCSAVVLEGFNAGLSILAFLIVLSLGRSACSLTVKDIEADVVPKGERGNLVGLASTISGVMTLIVAVPLLIFDDSFKDNALLGVIVCAAVSFIITLLCMFNLKTKVEDNSDNKGKMFSVRFDKTVYKFVFVRGLFVHSALVAPYFMLENGDNAQKLLPVYIAAQALASMCSSLLWGKVADYSAKLTLQIAGVLTIAACAGLLAIESDTLIISACLFFILSIAHAGVRTGRKTYSLDVKEGQERTELVGFSNTAIGIILLTFGAIYAALSPFLSFSVVYIMTGMMVVATITTLILPNEK